MTFSILQTLRAPLTDALGGKFPKRTKSKWEERPLVMHTRNLPFSCRMLNAADVAGGASQENLWRLNMMSSSFRESPKSPHGRPLAQSLLAGSPNCYQTLKSNECVWFGVSQSLSHQVWSRESFIIRRIDHWEGRDQPQICLVFVEPGDSL